MDRPLPAGTAGSTSVKSAASGPDDCARSTLSDRRHRSCRTRRVPATDVIVRRAPKSTLGGFAPMPGREDRAVHRQRVGRVARDVVVERDDRAGASPGVEVSVRDHHRSRPCGCRRVRRQARGDAERRPRMRRPTSRTAPGVGGVELDVLGRLRTPGTPSRTRSRTGCSRPGPRWTCRRSAARRGLAAVDASTGLDGCRSRPSASRPRIPRGSAA